MGADAFVVVNVLGLVELADHVGELQQRVADERRVARVGVEIAVALFRCRELRRTAAQVEDQIADRGAGFAGAVEIEGFAG